MSKYLSGIIVIFSLLALTGCTSLANEGFRQGRSVLVDNQTRDMVRDISTGLQNYYANNSAYPEKLTRNAEGVLVGDKLVEYSHPGNVSAVFCYATTPDGFTLGGKLNSGEYFSLGATASSEPCGDSQAIPVAE